MAGQEKVRESVAGRLHPHPQVRSLTELGAGVLIVAGTPPPPETIAIAKAALRRAAVMRDAADLQVAQLRLPIDCPEGRQGYRR